MNRLERILTICLGGFWLLDGILQLQPAMFGTAFVSAVLTPNLQSQPRFIASIIAFGIYVWNINPVLNNLIAAVVQIAIGALLIFPFRAGARRFGLWLSVAWALIIWIFGEGFGGLATGSATFYTGAPGAALLYLIMALFLLYAPQKLSLKKLPLVAGILFLIGAVLNLMPMFWHASMLSMLATVPAVSGLLGTIGSQGTLIGNLIAIDALACLGAFLMLMPNRAVAWTTMIFLLLVWWIGQDFGGLFMFPGGTATDPDSALFLVLFLVPIFLKSGLSADSAER